MCPSGAVTCTWPRWRTAAWAVKAEVRKRPRRKIWPRSNRPQVRTICNKPSVIKPQLMLLAVSAHTLQRGSNYTNPDLQPRREPHSAALMHGTLGEGERKHQHMWVLSEYKCAVRETNERVSSVADKSTRWEAFNAAGALRKQTNGLTKCARAGDHQDEVLKTGTRGGLETPPAV